MGYNVKVVQTSGVTGSTQQTTTTGTFSFVQTVDLQMTESYLMEG